MRPTDSVHYFFNVTLPQDVTETTLDLMDFMSVHLWWVFLVLMLLFIYIAYTLSKRYSKLERSAYDLNRFMYDYATVTNIDKATKELMKFQRWLRCEHIALYQLQGDTYILISSDIDLHGKEATTSASLHLSRQSLKTYTTLGDYTITSYVTNDEQYLFRAYARKRIRMKSYQGIIEILMAHYKSLREDDEHHTELQIAKTAKALYDTINGTRFGDNGYMRYLLSMIKKVVDADRVCLLSNSDEIKIDIGHCTACHKKTFFLRNTDMKVETYTQEPLRPEALKTLGSFLDLTGIFISTLNEESTMARNYVGFLEQANALLENDDPYQNLHSKKVRSVALEIGKVLFLSMDELDALDHASSLHDIGSIGDINDLIQDDYDESDSYKLHPIIGSILLEPVANIYPVASIIKYHHERIDGKGYPYGLKGNEIPKLAQILALSEYFIGLTSDSSFKAGMRFEDAVKMLRDSADKMYDKVIIDAFLSAQDEIRRRLARVQR